MSRVDFGTLMLERFKLHGLLFGIFLMVVSAITTVREFGYLLSGDIAQAKVVSVNRALQSGNLMLSVQFTDNAGNVRTPLIRGNESAWTEPAPGSEVEVEYLPGPDGAVRLSANSMWIMTIPFVVGTVVFLVASIQFWREYAAHQRREASWREEYS